MTGWAVLATGALIASLLAVGAAPVGAQDSRLADTPDDPAKTSACVGDALDDQMFTDVSDDHAFGDAINCIAYYEITNGTGDGSTYSPNQDVTRAEMALFIARAAEAAGVDLGDAMSAGFTDIGDTWAEAQDAINRLASKGVIASGGAFRPSDAITRAEMATFLVGMLVKAAPNVKIDSTNGDILLGSGAGQAADDWFADARASVPVANDAEISALYELGVTKGASAAAVQDTTKPPLDTNYEPFGTVNRGEMAAFITRALAHTSVRPAGISAQFDGTNVVVSARDENFQPKSNVTVDVFRIDTAGIDLAFRGDGSCGETSSVVGNHVCEIDGADLLTGGGGDQSVALGDLDDGGTTVWAWTGDNMDTVGSDTDLYQLDIAPGAVTRTATRVRVSTDHPANKKVHLGSSVLYTVQLEDARGPVTVGMDTDKPRPAQFLVTVSTWAYAPVDTTPTDQNDQATSVTLARNPQGTSLVSTIPLTTDADGKATFSVSGLPDPNPGDPGDKYVVEIKIQPAPGGGNAPAAEAFHIGATAGAVAATDIVARQVNVRVNNTANDGGGISSATDGTVVEATEDDGLIFSTAARSTSAAVAAAGTTPGTPGLTVSVKPTASYVAASTRGASNRATATVTDQYGDPVAGARVSLASAAVDSANAAVNNSDGSAVTIGGGRALAVGRDGSYTFGYTRVHAGAATETLTASWDHDGDGCATADATSNPANPVNDVATCADIDGDGTADDPGTAPITGPATVQWAAAPTGPEATGKQIFEFDTDTNTIFVGDDADTDGVADNGSVLVLNYDSNDRFNIDPAGDNADGSSNQRTSSYAEFEKMLSKASSYTLEWLAIGSGSRATNTFTLNTP